MESKSRTPRHVRAVCSFALLLALLPVYQAYTNNLSVSNVALTGQNASLDYTFIQCDISWENSWRVSGAPSNWDAAWVFAKYRIGSGPWLHATLNTTEHAVPVGSTIDTPGDGKGVFIYRSTDGSGTFSPSNIQLRWNYGVDGVADEALVVVNVFAIEMVYIPSGSFYVGSGGTESTAFYTYPDTTVPYQITSEAAIVVDSSGGNLYYKRNLYPGDQLGPIPAAFPKGTSAFYCMKYEISQKQYVDFLNTLTYSQQVSRTGVPPDTVAGVTALVDTGSFHFRNGIEVMTPGVASTTPAVYACDFTNDGVYNQSNDGQDVACNWLSWADGIAYSDWAGLRPMTELEFEKACRGPLSPVANEYAWASTTLVPATSIANGGLASEVPGNAGANAVCSDLFDVRGVLRVGSISTGSTTTRATSGATYYGVMNMSDNAYERCVTVGKPQGRTFVANNGDGGLGGNGHADVATWPDTTAVGSCFRGGFWYNENAPGVPLKNRVSDRFWGSYGDFIRLDEWGFRSVRNMP